MSHEDVKFRESDRSLDIVNEIEEDIAKKTAASGLTILLEEDAPPMYARGGGWLWLLGRTRGFRLQTEAKTEAEKGLKAEDFEPPCSIDAEMAEYVLVRWHPFYRLFPKWYIYWKTKKMKD